MQDDRPAREMKADEAFGKQTLRQNELLSNEEIKL